MKNTFKVLMALAVALSLVPASHAQTFNPEKYVDYPDQGVGLNKFLKSTTPNEAGEYTLRIETFTTGTVSKSAIPTDFVLVLDCSGSMHYDCLYGQDRPESVTKAANDNSGFLRPAHSPENNTLGYSYSHYSYYRAYTSGNMGEMMPETGNAATMSAWSYFVATTGTSTNSAPSRYYYYEPDQKFYLIHHETVSSHYRLYITTSGNTKRYIICTQDGDNVTTTVSTTPPTNNTSNDSQYDILLIGYEGDKIYRPLTRMEALEDGVDKFIDEIYTHNEEDNFATGVTKHQVSIVAFGTGYSSGDAGYSTEPSIAENHVYGSGSRVVFDFAEINGSTKDNYKNALHDYFAFKGDTYVLYGMRLARRLLENLQTKNGMAPLNSLGGINRNKVVVLFTDGEPSILLSNGGAGTEAAGANAFNNVKLSLQEAKTIKTVRTSVNGTQINGKVFSIDLSGVSAAGTFLKYASSNYPNGAATSGTTLGTIQYSGTLITPASDRIFYMDVNSSASGLEAAFKSIVDANTGDTSAHMVAVDVINDSFDLPEGVSDKVNLFTAQCIGTKVIDGATYLAFAEDVPVSNRPALGEIWFNSVDDGGTVSWEKKENLDIDAGITYQIEGKKLIFKGFDFANLWCGLDDDPTHNNTRQIEDDDPNFAFQVDGYRGFKLIAEFPIVIADDAVGGPDVPTNVYDLSGLFPSDGSGVPNGDVIVKYPKPALTIPIKLIIQKSGLNPGESASFTIDCKPIDGSSDWTEFTTFVLTGISDDDNPEIRLLSLDPTFYYRVRETGWSWAYQQANPATFNPSTENPNLANPIIFANTPSDSKRAEAKSVNKMRATGSEATTVYDETK